VLQGRDMNFNFLLNYARNYVMVNEGRDTINIQTHQFLFLFVFFLLFFFHNDDNIDNDKESFMFQSKYTLSYLNIINENKYNFQNLFLKK